MANKFRAFLVLALFAGAIYAQEQRPDPPTEISAFEIDEGIQLRWKRVPGIYKYNIYRDNAYYLTVDVESEAEAYYYIDADGSANNHYSMVSVATFEESGNLYSTRSDNYQPLALPKNQTPGVSNAIESLITLGAIGLGASSGDYVCVTATISVNDSVRLPNARFCFEIDKSY